MKAYLALFRSRFLTLLQYRIAAMAGIATQVFWGIVKVMVLAAFYTYSQEGQPISLEQAAIFVWLGQACLPLLPWNIDKEIDAQVKTGNVAYELIRPIDLYQCWFVRGLALRLIPFLLRGIPLYIIAVLCFALPLPISIAAAGAFSTALFLAVLLSAAMSAFFAITLFWTISGEGIQRLLPHITLLFSGLLVPLPLFPSSFQTFLNLQPFRGIIDIPIRLYSGIIPISEAPYYIGFQLFWLCTFVVLGKLMMNKAIRRLAIQGG